MNVDVQLWTNAKSDRELHELIDPLLETADLPDLNPGHRAAASNALCSIIECCQASKSEYAREAILDDSVWLRLFNIYLQRSDDAKGKSMRQMLLLLTGVITKYQSARALELRLQAAAAFVDVICDRQDRIKVKPALQGLAHFLLRDVVSIAQLLEIYGAQSVSSEQVADPKPQDLFKAFLVWVVHHDTSLSAGHLVKNFLIQARRSPDYTAQDHSTTISPLWIEPVVQMLHQWPDRLREFKANVFPHCFMPNIDEYLRFLSYLRFGTHVQSKGDLPDALRTYESRSNRLDRSEEFKILLAALETGKELTIVRDIGKFDFGCSSFFVSKAHAIQTIENVIGSRLRAPRCICLTTSSVHGCHIQSPKSDSRACSSRCTLLPSQSP